nr:complement resistance protein TraT [Klebsiella pneumoniae subsp. pneumoniae]
MFRSRKEPKHRFRLITWPYYVRGTSGAKVQTSTETGNQHKYQTRVVSNANKVNLKFPEAQPVLEDQLAKSIANIL